MNIPLMTQNYAIQHSNSRKETAEKVDTVVGMESDTLELHFLIWLVHEE
jgi:hypothetical protein